MNNFMNKGIVTEIKTGNNFEYLASEEVSFAETDYKVLQNQTEDIFVPCIKIIRDGKLDFCYACVDYRPLKDMNSGLTSEAAISITTDILSALTKVRANGVLSCENVVLSTDKIYIDGKTKKVHLTYIPLNEKLYESSLDFEEVLRNTIHEILAAVPIGRTEKLDELTMAIDDRGISIDRVYNKARSATAENLVHSTIPVRPVNNYGHTSAIGTMNLIACDAPYPCIIRISESDVLIGKKAELVDKVIDFNNAISRRHCRVVKQNGGFCIIDEGSANGTFVNGKRLEPGVKTPIEAGDVVRLANSDFRVN